jgi:hypothetical protein
MRVVYGVWRLSKLKQPVVTVFGGSKIEQGHQYARQAHELFDSSKILGKLLLKP